VEQNSDLLFSEAVSYINVDTTVMCLGFFASSTPQLDDFLYEITKKVVVVGTVISLLDIFCNSIIVQIRAFCS